MAIRNYGVDWENNRGVHYAIGLYAIEKIRKKGFIKMARCYYLDYESNSLFGNDNDYYYCKLCGKRFRVDDPQVKYTCNPSYGEEYKKCPIYKDRRY